MEAHFIKYDKYAIQLTDKYSSVHVFFELFSSHQPHCCGGKFLEHITFIQLTKRFVLNIYLQRYVVIFCLKKKEMCS